jgi:hypothetical protein
MTLCCFVLAYLYWSEKSTPVETAQTPEPVMVTNEVEIIKEVPILTTVTNTVEVPTPVDALTERLSMIGSHFLDARAGEIQMPPAGLKGLPNFAVMVEVDEELIPYLKKADLQTKVELFLRRQGIAISDNADGSEGPVLYVAVRSMWIEDGSTADEKKLRMVLNIMAEVWARAVQYIDTGGDFIHTVATVWNDANLLIAGTNRLPSYPLEVIENMLGRLCNEYLKANPKD